MNKNKKENSKIVLLYYFTKEQTLENISSEINKKLSSLSIALKKKKIYHVIIKDKKYGQCLALADDMPSICIYNEKEKQWEYMIRYFNEKTDEPDLERICVIQDSNLAVNIVDFIQTWLKIKKEIN